LLSAKYKNIMFSPFLDNYAYGWKIFNVGLSEPSDSVKVIWHGGGLFGFSGIIIRFVEDKHLIVVLLNNTGSLRPDVTNGLCREITNILYDRPFQFPSNLLQK
jgi:hypothetical protein